MFRINIIEKNEEENRGRRRKRRRRRNIFDVPWSFFLIFVVSESVEDSQNKCGTLMIPKFLLFKTSPLFCENKYINDGYFICSFLTELLVIWSV